MTNPTPAAAAAAAAASAATPGSSPEQSNTAPHLHPDAAARFRDYTQRPVTPGKVEEFPAGSAERVIGEAHLREQDRRQRIHKAISWYTSPALGFTITPINFPVIIAKPSTPSSPGTAGLNSDGKLYLTEGHPETGPTTSSTTDPNPHPDSDNPNSLARIDRCRFLTISKTLPDGTQLPSNYSNSPGKNPVLTGFTRTPQAQARTPEQAAALWSAAPWNVGIVTGPSTGTICIDIDARHHGLEMFKLLTLIIAYISDAKKDIEPAAASFHDDLRQTFGYSSSGGGFHLLYQLDRDDTQLWKLVNRMGTNPLPGVDLKTRPGIVVAAPSLHATGDIYNTPNPTLPPHSTQRTYPPRQLSLTAISTLFEAFRVIKSLPTEIYAQLFSYATQTIHINTAITQQHFDTITAIISRNNNTINTSLSDTSGTASRPVTNTQGAGGFAALSTQAAEREAAPSPVIASGDNPMNEGYYSRQVEHWLTTGSAHTTFGPGEHNDSLKGLIGALLRLVPITQTMGTFYANQMRRDPSYIPPLYASLAIDLDEAVTRPKPWHQTESGNFTGLLRYAVKAELESLGYLERGEV